jgi:nitroreductase
MRRLKPDPVPDELLNKILQAAQWAQAVFQGKCARL